MLNNKHILNVHNKFSEIYSGLLVLPIDYCKSFMPFDKVKHPRQNDKLARVIFVETENPTKRCQATDFILFINTTLPKEHYKIWFTVFGSLPPTYHCFQSLQRN